MYRWKQVAGSKWYTKFQYEVLIAYLPRHRALCGDETAAKGAVR